MLTDILPTGFHGAVNAAVGVGSTVYVAGAGPVGMAAAASAYILGAAVVMVGDMNPELLAHAKSVDYEPIDLTKDASLEDQIAQEPASNIRISKLVIESNSLPDADRERIVHLFQQKTYPQGEIDSRIQIALRDLSYFQAVVDEPKFSFPTQVEGRRIANVIVEPGPQYRLDKIRFQNATIFPSTQLRTLFSVQRGEHFNTPRLARAWSV